MFWIIALLIGLFTATVAYALSKPASSSPAPPAPEPITVLLNYGGQTLQPLESGPALVQVSEVTYFPSNTGDITFLVTNLTNQSYPNIARVQIQTVDYDWSAQEGRYEWLIDEVSPSSITTSTVMGVTRINLILVAPPVSNDLSVRLRAFSGTPLTVPLSSDNNVGFPLLNYVD